jgi:hypothetical protein
LVVHSGSSDYDLVGGGYYGVAHGLSGVLDSGGALATGGLGGDVTRLDDGSRPADGAGRLNNANLTRQRK